MAPAGLPFDIWMAAKNGLLPDVQNFIAKGVDVNSSTIEQVTPLHEAAEAGQLEVVTWLLDHGANPNTRTIAHPGEAGAYTPLHLGVQNGHLEVSKTLLQRGANIDAKTSDGSTPLIIASENGRLDLVMFLVISGASLRLHDQMKHTPFTTALAGGHLQLAKYLLAQGSDVNHRTEPSDMTPLMFAALNVKPDQVEFLTKSGAEIGAIDGRGLTALHHAVIGGAARVRKTEWTDNGTMVTEDKPEDTEDTIKIIRLLLAAGADSNAKDEDGMSAMDWAKSARAQDLIKHLAGFQNSL
jgi:ankyrin repeat protein